MDLVMYIGTGFTKPLNWIKSLTPADFQNTTHIYDALDSNLVQHIDLTCLFLNKEHS